MATWLAGGFLATLGSPLAIPLLSGKVAVENLPTANQGLFLEDRGSYMVTCLQLAPWPDSIYALVDATVKHIPDCFEAGKPGYSSILKRASIEIKEGRVCLIPEHSENTADQNKALVLIDAGRGSGDYLNYQVGDAKVFHSIEGRDPIILAAISPGEKIVAVRSNWRWQNMLGIKSRKIIEQIDIGFDGENIQVISRVLSSNSGTGRLTKFCPPENKDLAVN